MIAIVFMGALALIGAIVALFFPQITSRARTSKRVASVSRGAGRGTSRKSKAENSSQNHRRKQVQETIRQLEERQKKSRKSLPISVHIAQAGLSISPATFWIASLSAGAAAGLGVLIAGMPPLVAGAAFFACSLGVPRWVLSKLCKRRQARFLEEFPGAIDIIVRGIKSGLPVNDCLRIISNEVADPVGPEFGLLVESQKMGVPMDKGLERMLERMPMAEVGFLGIVITIQQKTGGNLAEALSNLSRVLRDRKKMKGKVMAMAQEAKASAAIIGALPPLVMTGLYILNPDYMSLMWTTQTGQALLVCSAFWMLIGILVMKKMINFDF